MCQTLVLIVVLVTYVHTTNTARPPPCSSRARCREQCSVKGGRARELPLNYDIFGS